MKIFHVICNPAAKRGHAIVAYRKIRAWAENRTDIKLSLHMTATPADATEITKQLTNTNEDVYLLVIGGDGTINEVINGIVNFEHTYIMIIPFGSGNDFVYTLGLKEKDPVEFMNDYAGQTKIFKCDYLLINNKYRAINSTGLGMSAETIKYRNTMHRYSPKMQYKVATIKKSLFWKRFVYWASFDNKPEIKIDTCWLVANNGKRIGGKVLVTPDAKLDDGLISVMYIDHMPRIHTLATLTKTMNGTLTKSKWAKYLTCKELNIVLKDNCLEYDGNLLEHLNALNIKIGEGKVNFILPLDTDTNK